MDADTEKFVDEVIADQQQPVVAFALEWCEFCWSIRKFFAKVGIAYRTIDLDSVPYQEDQRGQRIRAVLGERTGIKTIPQVFIGSKFVGGRTDVFDGWKENRIQPMLTASTVDYDEDSSVDPYGFLPDWLHPR
ncbi:MAG: glutaredoxin domain-containing protein [Gammaproteobacteria bacterium]|nr:glutaredoxin domain-containing protein [Gammaproteobacteria bacterium]MDP6616933.1 glutaredoxin domain-containing protein [Gammaproteobacteria bacterium]MDP6696043.1 glutaredoxin domain-containing protein [Gammaproteobacteria bacterium]MDP7041175.1 glutaredoxin domain-containing protein [Gammaproteobacteria bacterium]